jgi:hypothetical protein
VENIDHPTDTHVASRRPASFLVFALVVGAAIVLIGIIAYHQWEDFAAKAGPSRNTSTPLTPDPQSVVPVLAPDPTVLLELPGVVSSTPADISALPLPHDVLFRQDAKDIIVRAAMFAGGRDGYISSYAIIGDELENVCKFHALAFRKDGRFVITSRRTETLCTVDAVTDGLRIVVIVSPGESAAQVALTLIRE